MNGQNHRVIRSITSYINGFHLLPRPSGSIEYHFHGFFPTRWQRLPAERRDGATAAGKGAVYHQIVPACIPVSKPACYLFPLTHISEMVGKPGKFKQWRFCFTFCIFPAFSIFCPKAGAAQNDQQEKNNGSHGSELH